MTKIAWIFPGQGSQTQGMGVDLQNTSIGKEKFAEAEQILGWSVLDLCQSEDEKLSQTLYTQPCLYTVESILVDLLYEKGYNPDLVAGHSLGEYVALYAARVFDFEMGLRLVAHRSQLMNSASGGKMCALMGFKREELDQEIASRSDVVIANDNSEQQVVISGKPQGVDELVAKVKTKKAVELKVSGAFHSPFMNEAAKEFEQVLDIVNFSNAQVPVLSNVDPIPTIDATELKQRLVKQMIGSVRWREIMEQLTRENVNQVIEIGPGKVLTGLIKRACKNIELQNISSVSELPLK
jgi:[acyl-carrier-protein] S-malonyltransferase